MTKSMTGFGRGAIHYPYLDLIVEIKSFNHRYLDLTINLPRQWSYLEDKVKHQFRQSISRGKVDLYLSIEEDQLSKVDMVLNEEVADQYLNQLRAYGKQRGIEDDIKLSDLVLLPNIFSIKEKSETTEQIENNILATIQEALDQLILMREKEGANLKDDVELRLDHLAHFVLELKEHVPTVVQFYQDRLYKRLHEMLDSHMTVDEQRVLSEVAIFADKVNVDEEITRLLSHIDQFREILSQNNPIGRKLDFLIQEMNREINTIGSKGNNVHISQLVVDVKSEIEKIREQVQNIE